MESETVGFTRNKREPITSIVDMSTHTNVITLKTIHSDSFKKETIKTRIFILQIDNKITNVIKTFEKKKIRYIMSLLREITVE